MTKPPCAEAEQPVRNLLTSTYRPWTRWPEAATAEKQRLIDAGYAFYAADDFPNLRNLSYQELIDAGIVCVGSPDSVGKQLLALWQEFRFDEMIVISHYGGIDKDRALRTQDLFAKKVMPMMQAETHKALDAAPA